MSIPALKSGRCKIDREETNKIGEDCQVHVQGRSLIFHLHTLWLFTRNDFKVIVLPESAVGIFNALAGAPLTTNSAPNLSSILSRLPFVIFWNWFNLLTFNIANQRLQDSILEDTLNKPFRPLPSNRISANGARHLLLALLPVSLLIAFFFGGLKETGAMIVLTWMYNDLGGADENFLLRNLINACGFICHGSGATIIAAGLGEHKLTTDGYVWLLLTGVVVLTSLQVQDLPDMIGDAARGRGTLPLVWGETWGRWSVAVPVLAWSLFCPWFWGLGVSSYILTLILGLTVAGRVLLIRNEPADQLTYKIWCLWLIFLYLLPLIKNHEVLRKGF